VTQEEPPEWWDTTARLAASLVPVFGGTLQVIYEDTRRHVEARVARTMGEVVEETGIEVLRQRLSDSPEVEALFVQALDAATRTGHEGKRRLLGRLISTAVLDDAKVDESLLFVLALRDLDGPHIRALEAMRRAGLKVEMESFARGGPDERGYGPTGAERLENSVRAEIKNDTRGVPSVITVALRSHGLIQNRRTWDGTSEGLEHCFITGFGRLFLDYLREVEVVAHDASEDQTAPRTTTP
jgi:hypothetical protein